MKINSIDDELLQGCPTRKKNWGDAIDENQDHSIINKKYNQFSVNLTKI